MSTLFLDDTSDGQRCARRDCGSAANPANQATVTTHHGTFVVLLCDIHFHAHVASLVRSAGIGARIVESEKKPGRTWRTNVAALQDHRRARLRKVWLEEEAAVAMQSFDDFLDDRWML